VQINVTGFHGPAGLNRFIDQPERIRKPALSKRPLLMHLTQSLESSATFAASWLAAWNERDLDRILAHYSRDIEFTSPFVSRILGQNKSTLYGIPVLRVYFSRSLNAHPDLRFRLRRVYSGHSSLVIEYQSVSDHLAAEMMEFNDAGQVVRASAHYVTADPEANG